jgi:hypothetical protein
LLRTSWVIAAGFNGERRTGIPISEILSVLNALHIPATARRLNLLTAAIHAIVNDDIKALNEKSG